MRSLLVFTLLSLDGGAPPEPDAAKAEMKKLEGTWKLVKAVGPGGEADVTFVFKGDKLTIRHRELRYTLNPSKRPKWVDVGGEPGATLPGIYKLEGDRLTIFLTTGGKGGALKRPRTFDLKEKFHGQAFFLQRVKKK